MEEVEPSGSSISAVARKYGINPNQLFRWRKPMEDLLEQIGKAIEWDRTRTGFPTIPLR